MTTVHHESRLPLYPALDSLKKQCFPFIHASVSSSTSRPTTLHFSKDISIPAKSVSHILKMPEDQSQPQNGKSGDGSEGSRNAVQGGAGTEKTPADSGTAGNITGSVRACDILLKSVVC